MGEPASVKKSNLCGKLQSLVDDLTEQFKIEAQDRKKNEGIKWTMPPKAGWDGDIFKWNKMDKPFDSTQPNEELTQTISSGDSPGRTGDLVNTNTSIDYLAAMERAFRARHTMTFPRNVAHATARKHGLGHDKGPLKLSLIDYLKDLQKTTTGKLPTSTGGAPAAPAAPATPAATDVLGDPDLSSVENIA